MKISYECKKCGEVFQDMFHRCDPEPEHTAGQRRKGDYMTVLLCPEDKEQLNRIEALLQKVLKTILETEP